MTIPLDAVPAPAFVVDVDSVIVDANERAAELAGRGRGEMLGQPVAAFLPDIEGKKYTDDRPLVSVGESTFVVSESGLLPGRDGDRLLVLTDVSTLASEHEAAVELAQSRSSFLGKLSHEIRSAVASMTGFAEILEEQVAESNRELAGLIALSGRHLMDTLSAVMDLARIEFGEKEVELKLIDVIGRIRDRVTIFRPDAEQKGLELTFDPDDDVLHACLNPILLDRILHNLIDNAIKYTEEGRIEVDVEQRDGRIWLYVADTGRGMNAAFIPRLFSPFEREVREGEKSSGSGLGLAVTRYLVELMHGGIYACSTAGAGSTFTVSFPEPEANASALEFEDDDA